jgi:ribosomal protein S18 acetylase RimI-like enzyme
MPHASPAALQIRPTDLTDPRQATAFVHLLEHYARDPMGGGAGLSGFARAHVVERLATRPGFVGFMAWAGEADGMGAVGLINCFEGFSTFAARPLLNIHDIVVRDGHRAAGIGQALLRAAEDAARARDCCKLTLEVLSNNRRALASYARFGFRPYELDPAAGQALFLEKKLAPPAG